MKYFNIVKNIAIYMLFLLVVSSLVTLVIKYIYAPVIYWLWTL